MRSDDEKKNELIADVYRADRVYEAERRSAAFRAAGDADFEFIGKELFRKGYRRQSEIAAEIIDAVEKIILENTYPSSDYNKKPVTIWKSKTGYDALDELKKKYK